MDHPIDAIYEKGTLRLVNPARLDSDIVTVKVLNRDEVLTDEDLHDLVDAIDEHEKGKTSSFNDVFD